MEENTSNKNVVFSETKINKSARAMDLSWGKKIAQWVIKISGGAIKTEQQANNYLILASVAVIFISVLIAIYVGT